MADISGRISIISKQMTMCVKNLKGDPTNFLQHQSTWILISHHSLTYQINMWFCLHISPDEIS